MTQVAPLRRIAKLTNRLLRRVTNRSYDSARRFGLARLRREAERCGSHSPLLVYSMGKVGTSSIHQSLHASLERTPVYHLHTLSPELIASEEKVYRKNFPRLRVIHDHLLASLFLRPRLDGHTNGEPRWKIISLVRDPLKRNISAFFQGLDLHAFESGFYDRICAGGDASLIDDLADAFTKSVNHERHITWFDREIRSSFGIDVFASGFSPENGYEIYEGENADLLVIRLENLNQCVDEALSRFIGIDHLELVNKQVGSRKYYAAVYKDFRESVKLPDSLLDFYYDSKFARTFYSAAELRSFRDNWQGRQAG